MKIQMLPSTFDALGGASPEQRFTCFLLDDCVAVDAGCLALALSETQRAQMRDVIITHPHMDHIASLPIFIDDLFATLEQPVRVYATQEIIEVLERDIFNWTIYPRFSELRNEHGPVLEYVPVVLGEEFQVRHLQMTPVAVNHIVPTFGLVVTDTQKTVAFSSDTAATDAFWRLINEQPRMDALLIETSFPDELAELAWVSRHFTPASLATELTKLNGHEPDVLIVHIKPTYRDQVIQELEALGYPKLQIMLPGLNYEW